MSSRYDVIWEAVKKVGWAEVTVSTGSLRTVEEGLIHSKSLENSARRKVGLVGWSKLVITRTKLSDLRVRVRFELLYRTDL